MKVVADSRNVLMEVERIEKAFNEIMDVIKPEIWEEEEITSTQFQILKTLSSREKWTVSEIADAMKVRASATTVIIDRLVKRGLVDRYRSDLDRRIVYVQLNETGLVAFHAIQEKRNGVLIKYMSQLTDKQLADMVQCIERLSSIVKN
ncbi:MULTISPECIES: MarR family winged helix-turn-helix transcriptional regulator [Fictibacillus]|uniref:MarR family winged helix-turn-helix transcriptional regulator n=1 Tax=Fictibacillus TaxID=1329200 RepID=UPI0018CFA642|nr:MarR family transcriptional regulator [Fictibacillus sp. 5RED26]MBH0161374.1 MarR family transcriptional regulator [Fictibacillus sp. 26RED30]MBH0164724.1 MarR family transcriptional regulator [Fictibacillus sp. 7GRE50]MBH0172674.1 MarR family transcriptional regulator [Fictibacillus sp. 23RED33]